MARIRAGAKTKRESSCSWEANFDRVRCQLTYEPAIMDLQPRIGATHGPLKERGRQRLGGGPLLQPGQGGRNERLGLASDVLIATFLRDRDVASTPEAPIPPGLFSLR